MEKEITLQNNAPNWNGSIDCKAERSKERLESILLEAVKNIEGVKVDSGLLYRCSTRLNGTIKRLEVRADRVDDLTIKLCKAYKEIDSFKKASVFKIACNRLSRFVGFRFNLSISKVNRRGGF